MEDFQTQMDKWWKECKARAYIQPTDDPVRVNVNVETELDKIELYDPIPEDLTEVQVLTQINMPKF